MIKRYLIVFVISLVPNILSYGDCYIQSPTDQSFVQNTFSQYIEQVYDIPISGIRQEDCLYQVESHEKGNIFCVTINGPRNFYAEAPTFRQAFLTSIFDSSKQDLCELYPDILKERCSLDVDVLFMNVDGVITKSPGNQFVIILVPRDDFFVYVINEDRDSNVKILFHKEVSRDKVYILPEETEALYYQSNDITKEKISLLFSKKPINNLAFLLNTERTKGIFQKTILDFK